MDDRPEYLEGKEFIFVYGVSRIFPPSEKTGGLFATEQRAYRRERVVRCRDCANAFASGGQLDCLHFAQWDYYNDKPGIWPVEPDGFCKWGKPKEEE